MLEFLKKITEWVLQKEEELAKDCRVSMDDLEKQLKLVKEKREKLQKECQENMQELDKIIGRLESIKNIELVKCNSK